MRGEVTAVGIPYLKRLDGSGSSVPVAVGEAERVHHVLVIASGVAS